MSDQLTDEKDLLPGDAAERTAEHDHGLSAISSEELPMLPGEVMAHPEPFQYVMIAVVLCVPTALEVGIYYLPEDFPTWLEITMLLVLALIKFIVVASWYMHLRTDRPIFRRFFVMGAVGAILLYTIVLATLHAFVS